MPAFVKSRLGDEGSRLEEGTTVCAFSRKKSRKDWRISAEVMMGKTEIKRRGGLGNHGTSHPEGNLRLPVLLIRNRKSQAGNGATLASQPRQQQGHDRPGILLRGQRPLRKQSRMVKRGHGVQAGAGGGAGIQPSGERSGGHPVGDDALYLGEQAVHVFAGEFSRRHRQPVIDMEQLWVVQDLVLLDDPQGYRTRPPNDPGQGRVWSLAMASKGAVTLCSQRAATASSSAFLLGKCR